jgi:hypothetical protein
MFSHTVPKKLLEQFAYYDPVTKSQRLWQYHKARAPWWKASPKTATAWEGHFADPDNKAREAEIELRLKQEFEDPVNDFLDSIGNPLFQWKPEYVRLLTGYVRMLFNRSTARQDASAIHAKEKIRAIELLLSNEKRLLEIAHQRTKNFIERGIWISRPVTKRDVVISLKGLVAKHSRPDQAQRDYVRTLENMMTFSDETMLNGDWGILRTDPEHPFVVGDAPVVTFERTEQNTLYWGVGFARPNVEVFLPVSPTACFHILPRVKRTRPVLEPSPIEVNMAQAAFARDYCFANVNSPEIDAILQAHFGTVRMGVTGFNVHHIDASQILFDILKGRCPNAA